MDGMGHDGDESGHCKRDWWQIVHSIKALLVGQVLVEAMSIVPLWPCVRV